MRTQIHPTFYEDAVVTCVCGNTFKTGSVRQELKTEICSACHPFFTGQQRIVDTGGQVERFNKRAAKVAASSAAR
jgi:large subunit ribosomal protein L31